MFCVDFPDDFGRVFSWTGEIPDWKSREEEVVRGCSPSLGRVQRGRTDENPDSGIV